MKTYIKLFILQICLGICRSEDISDRSPEAHRRRRERQKELRKIEIKDFIERSFNWKGKNMPTGEEVKEKVSKLPELIIPLATTAAPDLHGVDYTERVQSFFPECIFNSRPEWLLQCPEDPNIDIQFYNIRFPNDRPGTKVKVNAAKLRLYKLGVSSNSRQFGETNNIRVTVFLLKLRNRQNRLKPADDVMVDSDMFDSSIPGWLSLDVTSAVEFWHNHPHRPMGIMIRVEDDRGRPVPAKKVLQPLNCNMDLNSMLNRLKSQPVPMVEGEVQMQNFNSENQPLIDVSTIEIPDGENIPESLVLWGLPKKSSLQNEILPYTGAVQNLEIRHFPEHQKVDTNPDGSETDLLKTIKEVDYLSNSRDDSMHAPEIQTLKEVDFLGVDDKESRNRENIKRQSRNKLQPVKTRVIISNSDLQKKMAELHENQERIANNEHILLNEVQVLEEKQKVQSDFFRDLILSLMTNSEKRKVFGRK